MAGRLIQLSLILFSFFFGSSQNQQHDNHLIAELQEAKLKIAELESVLEESLINANAKGNYIDESEKSIDDRANEIRDLQSLLTKIKDDSSHDEERLKAMEEEIRLLWSATRKNNFDIHNLGSKAEDTEDRLEEVTSQVQKMSEIVTEQWIQIQHLEQALHIAELRTAKVQRQQKYSRCTFLKFLNDLSEKPLSKLLGMLEPYLSGKGSALSSYVTQAQQQFKRFFLGFQKFHHELQGFIKQEMVKNELTAVFANEELIFFLASALITFPMLAAWVLF